MYTNTHFFGLLSSSPPSTSLSLAAYVTVADNNLKKEFMNQVNVPRLKRVYRCSDINIENIFAMNMERFSLTHSTSSRICRQYDVMLLLLFSRVHYSLNNSYSKLHATAVCVCFSLSNSGFPSHSLSLSNTQFAYFCHTFRRTHWPWITCFCFVEFSIYLHL